MPFLIKRSVSAQQNHRDFLPPRAMSDNEIDVGLSYLEALGLGPSRRIEIDAAICAASVLHTFPTVGTRWSMLRGRHRRREVVAIRPRPAMGSLTTNPICGEDIPAMPGATATHRRDPRLSPWPAPRRA